ncbi:MAG: hypothetical protein QOG75_3606 [Mycobacterium sp.]|jgi:hypothetical protein|nr:hypothetical protein [Mycobacterium sp.]
MGSLALTSASPVAAPDFVSFVGHRLARPQTREVRYGECAPTVVVARSPNHVPQKDVPQYRWIFSNIHEQGLCSLNAVAPRVRPTVAINGICLLNFARNPSTNGVPPWLAN